jgi:hypothetical protein
VRMDFYSARLLVVCLVDDGKPRKRNTCDYPFIVFRAKGYEHALRRALALGKEQEVVYANANGQKVRWAFVGVEEINHLGKNLDGLDVGSRLDVLNTDKAIPFTKRFDPRRNGTYFTPNRTG